MLNIYCPICQRDCDETELICGGQAHLIRRDHSSSDKDFYKYRVYMTPEDAPENLRLTGMAVAWWWWTAHVMK